MKDSNITFKNAFIALILSIFLFFSFFTIFYPFSPYSLNKSFTYEKPWSSGTGGTYSEIVKRFSEQYDMHLKDSSNQSAVVQNIIVSRTQSILPMFEQKWIQDEQKTKITEDELQIMKHTLTGAKSIIHTWLFDWDMNYYIKSYLKNILLSIEYQVEVIDELLTYPYYTRSELKRVIGNLGQSYHVLFGMYKLIYEEAIHNPPTYSLQP